MKYKLRDLGLRQFIILLIIYILLIGTKKHIYYDEVGEVENYRERDLKIVKVFSGFQYSPAHYIIEWKTISSTHKIVLTEKEINER